ncbi:TBC1 domain family member 23 isoform X2 [Agrilus planipennis]|uniref:TBC1 domain family member 23 n=1 Tax=Agrilus planipennis TaxID=224129 RepID=A0A1W4XC32_AGRPL|nr:TBC1 domain family member 23 isoform X2 [Agrilus planipennis]
MACLDDDTSWVAELENALLEECTATDIYCICNGKSLPDHLRAEVWQICLDVRDKGNQLDHFDEVFDLPNQAVLREDCSNFVEKLGNDEEDRVSILSDLESILTFYCKSRNMKYEKNNGWIDILLPLLTLKVPRSTTYNLFEAIRDTFIPQSCHRKNGNAFHILRLLLLYHDPELCSFLDTKRITPEMYCTVWFQSLFAATCNLPVVINMWDYYFQQSDPFFVFFLSLIMVINARDEIMKMTDENRDEIASVLSQMPCALEPGDVTDFCSLAHYYTMKTPSSFRTDLMQELYSSRGEESTLVSQALCLPVSVNELIRNTDTIRSNSTDNVRFFLIDCRPVDQFNAGHLPTAFHLDCNLMLQEPQAFATAVQGLLSAQKQAIAANSHAGGEHLCFLGSGRNEEDQYTNMVVSSFLQKHTQYVSILTGGYIAIHNFFEDNLDEFIQDHNRNACIVCAPTDLQKHSREIQKNTPNSRDIFGKLSAAMKSKSVEVKEKFLDYIVNPNAGSPVQEKHVSSSDRKGKRYRNVAPVFSIDDDQDNVTEFQGAEEDTKEVVSLSTWLKSQDVIEQFPCQEVMVNRELPDKKGMAEIIVRRPLSAIVKITAKKRHPDLITFKYGETVGDSLQISDMDRFLIPNATKATSIVSEQIVKQLNAKD